MLQILLIAILISQNGISQFKSYESGVTVDLNDIFFYDALHGWAVGDSGTVVATTDGGDTWERQITQTDIPLSKVVFIAENYGYVLGGKNTILSTAGDSGSWAHFSEKYGFIHGGKNIILSTEDGGSSWAHYNFGENVQLRGISFINAAMGWVSGTDFSEGIKNSAVLYSTVDGGKTWEKKFEKPMEDTAIPYWFNEVIFTDLSNGLLFETQYIDDLSPTKVLKTKNGGVTWEQISRTSWPLFEVKIALGDTLWAAGKTFTLSYDAGNTWVRADEYHDNPTWKIAPVKGKTGWLLDTGGLTYTDDAGKTLYSDIVNWSYLPKGLYTEDRKLWISLTEGNIYSFGKNEPSVIDELNLPHDYKLEQNYPNPFNNSTVIKFSTKKQSLITLKIYDNTGKEIALITSKNYQPGTYAVVWDGKNNKGDMVSTGLYFCNLIADNYSETMKMILLK